MKKQNLKKKPTQIRSKSIAKPVPKADLKGSKKVVKQEESEESENFSSPDVRSITSESNGNHSESEEIIFSKGTYIAFVDPSEDDGKFKIGLVIEDQNDVSSDVMVNVYEQYSPLKYKLSDDNVAVAEYCIISEIEATAGQQPKGSKASKNSDIHITQQNYNMVAKLMQQTISALKDIEGSDSEEEEEEGSESEDESEEEEDPVEVIQNRRTVKPAPRIQSVNKSGQVIKNAPSIFKAAPTQLAKPQAKAKAQPQKSQPTRSKVGAAVAQKNNNKRSAPTKNQLSESAESDMDMEEEDKGEQEEEQPEEDADEQEDEDMVIVTKKMKQLKTDNKPKQAAKKPAQVGQKRQRELSKKSDNNEDEEEKGDNGSEDNDGSDGGFQIIKKRKVSVNKEKAVKKPKAAKVPKAKKAVGGGRKKPTEFKKGKWNPDIQLLDIDKCKEDPSNECLFECCIRCNSRNVIRAAITNNNKLLQNCLDANKQISLLTAYWSTEVKTTALEYMIRNNDHDLLETLVHPKVKIQAHNNYDNQRIIYYGTRVVNPSYLLNFVDSGMVNQMAYGTKVRQVQMTRGNRQGNNAFLQYVDNPSIYPNAALQDQQVLQKIFYAPGVTWETFKVLYKLNPHIKDTLNSMVHFAVKAGNREVAYEMIKDLVKLPNWGFNNLHMEVLGKSINQPKILKVSVVKKSNTNADITPLHCACINPNPNILKQLIDANNEIDVVDSGQRRPVHYAAACVSSGPLKVLIQAGANLNSVDNKKVNCLHIAAMTGRAENIRVILQTSPALLNTRTKDSMTAMAYACKYGHVEAVEALIQHKAKVSVGAGAERMPPMSWAAAYGHYDLVEKLIQLKGRVIGKDKYARTPLIMAVRNGHARIASLLLQNGAEWNNTDSSHNAALHYAAAYGWLECLDLLLKAGADINAQNSWKITPINIAMLKNHNGCVKRLLDEPNVDVNCKDEKGRTLLMLSLVQLDQDSKSFIKFLLKKGADPNIADLQGQTALHYVAKYNPKQAQQHNYLNQGQTEAARKADYEQKVEIQKHVTNLLIEHNADLSHKDNQLKTPFTICLDTDNAPLLNLLKNKISLNAEPQLLFAFENKIFNVEFQKILGEIINNSPPTKETMNVLNQQGLTPFLSYIRAYTMQYQNHLTQISQKINAQSFKNLMNENLYKLTNEQYFDIFADTTNYHTHNYQVTPEFKNNIAKKLLIEIILKPFLKLLHSLVQEGADPQAQVQKLQSVRDQEELERKAALELQQNGPKKELEEEKVVKLRDQIKSDNNHLRLNGHNTASVFGSSLFNQIAPQQSMKDISSKTTIKKEGKKKVREYSSIGLQNAVHIAVAQPTKELIEFLISLKIELDEPDYDGVTPFNLLSMAHYDSLNEKEELRKMLIKLDVRVDYPDVKGKTPFLNYYERSQFNLAYELLDLGANVNQMDNSGLFALKFDLIRRNTAGITTLLERGANINQIDNRGRNLLHHAVNMSSATADATFETEQFLIDKGVELNLRDVRGRTPLHYAFVKIKNWSVNHQIDPIETVSSLCGCKGLELDVPDKWNKTPLHYASQRAASCCAMYLIKLGAQTERKDIYNNTPLGVALLNNHFNYGILLIQKDSRVTDPVYRENPEELAKKWKEEAKLYKIQQKQKQKQNGVMDDGDIDMEDELKPKKKKVPKNHRNMFGGKADPDIDEYGNDIYEDLDNYDDEDDYDEEDADEYGEEDFYDKQRHDDIFNQQNAFGMTVFQQQPTVMYGRKKKVRPAKKSRFLKPALAAAQSAYSALPTMTMANSVQPVRVDETEGCSLFKLAIRAGQQGLAYLMMNSGYDLMLCIQDAMDEKKFMLVLTLLSKTPDDEVVQQKNNKNQNLIHILSMNAQGCQLDHLHRIFQALVKRGVDRMAKDKFNRTALHYAVISGSRDLVQLLLGEIESPYDTNGVDSYGHTPMSLHLKGPIVSQNLSNTVFGASQCVFDLLVANGADVNFIYPEETYKPAFKNEQVSKSKFSESYDEKEPYTTSIMINLIRQTAQFTKLQFDSIKLLNIKALLQAGARLDIKDSDGRDPLTYAVINNDELLIKALIDNQRAGLNTSSQDKQGKSLAHYVVNPLRYGSFENVKVLEVLAKAGVDLNLEDAEGRTPISYAREQKSGVMLKKLNQLLKKNGNMTALERKSSIIKAKNWPDSQIDYVVDSEVFMQIAKEKEEKEHHKTKKVPVDSTGRFESSYEVYYGAFNAQDDDEGKKRPWDHYMIKVDLKNGLYGDYVFYKMQMLYDKNRDLYVVFTRWGRIGEDGMNQRTPFNNIEEAKEDYKKIFKSKSANNLEDIDNFVKHKNKYNMARINYITTDYKEYMAPFDYEKCPKSLLNEDVYNLIEEISNVTMYQRAMSSLGVDTNVLPFSGLKKEVLIEAQELLKKLGAAVNECIEIQKEGIKANYEELTIVKDKISDLSSAYYELIPLANYQNAIAPPLSNQNQIQNQFDNLLKLTYIEQASKMLLGALFKQKDLNPVDYIHGALNMMIEPLDKDSGEYEVMRQYIANTSTSNLNQTNTEILNIFKIQRKGEAEEYENVCKDMDDKFLLYHGSQIFNFLGILSQGLRIAPPEAPPVGYQLGKGVYFADMFDKSKMYSSISYQQQDSTLMLMCEVALGNQKQVLAPEYIEQLPPQYQSLKALGRQAPGYDNILVLPNGVKVPYNLSAEQEYPEAAKQQPLAGGPLFGNYYYNNYWQFQHNEFVVYNTSQIRMRYLVQFKKQKPLQGMGF